MKTVQEASNTLRRQLNKHYDSVEAEAITMLVLGDVTGFSKAKLKAFGDELLTNVQEGRMEAISVQLEMGMPPQYVLGHTEFYGLDFDVSPAVLIPRPETEELVSWIIETVKQPNFNILDIGTGNGCIAISLKHELKQANVLAIDVSADALEIARANAVKNNVDINFIEADILHEGALSFENKFDVIVSNPPYVTESDKLQMHTNVTDFEPHTALFVPEDDPLLFYKAIASFALQNLNSNGLLFFEINESFAQQTIDMMTGKGFRDIELRQDIRGKDRMVKANNPLTPKGGV
ncbi:peptide chain release factor N(5)-glutamine methyltransferase [Mucilaginibacter ginkgonis]|uniref:Release factor glutamine methyltransferase n=1 Tax=Mucilaginibacter ginkgonis TaxID=2682091 RepID=A0A6I4IMV5_9SPHI|nr:peptide chain release factor N(5)-glutamine methyltransferase [Mucilaginibacter ginkgonis]QQL51113.1 peptide chain release factor N(5)-glutamine methyltransferase [Mucilaginibacter ginkgonis]